MVMVMVRGYPPEAPHGLASRATFKKCPCVDRLAALFCIRAIGMIACLGLLTRVLVHAQPYPITSAHSPTRGSTFVTLPIHVRRGFEQPPKLSITKRLLTPAQYSINPPQSPFPPTPLNQSAAAAFKTERGLSPIAYMQPFVTSYMEYAGKLFFRPDEGSGFFLSPLEVVIPVKDAATSMAGALYSAAESRFLGSNNNTQPPSSDQRSLLVTRLINSSLDVSSSNPTQRIVPRTSPTNAILRTRNSTMISSNSSSTKAKPSLASSGQNFTYLAEQGTSFDWSQQFAQPTVSLREIDTKEQSPALQEYNRSDIQKGLGKSVLDFLSAQVARLQQQNATSTSTISVSPSFVSVDVPIPPQIKQSKRQMLNSALKSSIKPVSRVARLMKRIPSSVRSSFVRKNDTSYPLASKRTIISPPSNLTLTRKPALDTDIILAKSGLNESWTSRAIHTAQSSLNYVWGTFKAVEQAATSLFRENEALDTSRINVDVTRPLDSEGKAFTFDPADSTRKTWNFISGAWNSLPFPGKSSPDSMLIQTLAPTRAVAPAASPATSPQRQAVGKADDYGYMSVLSAAKTGIDDAVANQSLQAYVKEAFGAIHAVFSLYKVPHLEDPQPPKPVPQPSAVATQPQKSGPGPMYSVLQTLSYLPLWSTFAFQAHADPHEANVSMPISALKRIIPFLPYVRLIPRISPLLRGIGKLQSGPSTKAEIQTIETNKFPTYGTYVGLSDLRSRGEDDELMYFQDTGETSSQLQSRLGLGFEIGDVGQELDILNETFPVRLQKGSEMRRRPVFVGDNFPTATPKDFSAIRARLVSVAVSAALAVRVDDEAMDFVTDIGIHQLTKALIEFPALRVDAVEGMTNLLKRNVTLPPALLDDKVIEQLVVMVEAPFRGMFFKNIQERAKELYGQGRVFELLYRVLLQSKDVEIRLRREPRLVKALMQSGSQQYSDDDGVRPDTALLRELLVTTEPNANVKNKKRPKQIAKSDSFAEPQQYTPPSLRDAHTNTYPISNKKSPEETEQTRIRALEISSAVTARKILWGLGGVQWKPKQPGQKGLRILSFDGGGTRGVLSIALLKKVFQELDKQPWEVFDIICGTSTGGILACLMGGYCRSLSEVEVMYDALIDRIFDRRNTSPTKLVVEQAFYSESAWEKILEGLCGDDVMLDTAGVAKGARVFCVSTMLNMSPGMAALWRNYNYAPNCHSRYFGSYRIPAKTAVRATTAAPTFFTPVTFEGRVFCDGAMLANNPTAIAIHEAKSLYPGVPIECVVSVGTGFHQKEKNSTYVGWDGLVSQLVNGATDTEHVHSVLNDFLTYEQYFRMNPEVDDIPIDEIRVEKMKDLKDRAEQFFSTEPNRNKLRLLQRILRGR